MAAAQEDQLLKTVIHRPSHTCWKPRPEHSLQLPSNYYTEFQEIVRTVHLEDYNQIRMAQRFIPQILTQTSHTHIISELDGQEGIWFGINGPDDGQHNWYGNVTLSLNFKNLLQTLGSYKIHFTEVVDFQVTSTSRLIVSTRNLGLPVYNPYTPGGPWYRDSHGKDWHLVNAHRFKHPYTHNPYGHTVELFLVITTEEAASLLNMSRIGTANHSEANNEGTRKCKKYRSGAQYWTECPTPYSREKTHKILNNLALSETLPLH
ncbi:uncharacterized protein LOC121862697 [Homarus americanus]|uniref:uncharacterized protein LOC121862697 n=1 Tax=Homarus americanus TaxID=6706 RepID=UPI001C489FB5|nr:uncharacterized protein LOC121862697 [Homarus americanus]